jgi:hypothetical protein
MANKKLSKTQKETLRWYYTKNPADLPENSGISTDRALAKLGLIDYGQTGWELTPKGLEIAERITK